MKYILNALWAIVLALFVCGAAQAELVATPLPGDTRLVQFEYDGDNTYLILAKPKAVSHIEFAADEVIVTVAGGDTKNWELTPTKNRRHLFVKPIYEQIETSMTVITDKRSYQFVLRSTGPGAKWYQRVTWRYGETILMDLRAEEERQLQAEKSASISEQRKQEQTLSTGVRPEDIKFGYELDGDAPFRPVSIFDDGKFTWIRMPAQLAELPALFGVSEDSEQILVNYIVKGDYLQAQRVMESGVLKLGKQQVRFERKPNRSWFGSR